MIDPRNHRMHSARVIEMRARHERAAAEMKREKARMARWFVAWLIFCLAISLASLAFVAWVIVMLLRHFGVI